MLPSIAHADTSPKDMAVAARALAFVEPRLVGSTSVAIVYDASSEADARAIKAGLAAAAIKGVSFQSRLVPVSDLGAIAGSRVVFVADGTGNQAAIAAASAKAHAVTISSDMGCVKAARCVVGVRAQPIVEIVVSKAARETAQVKFSQAFLMLVKEQ